MKIIEQLSDQFSQRFSDFDQIAEKVRQLGNPFSCDIDDFPLDMQMEVMELTSNETYKAKFHSPHSDLLTFYSSLPDSFKNIKRTWLETCFVSSALLTYVKQHFRR